MTESTVRSISDTARWVAYFRARESERDDALFRDPYAKLLAGDRGFGIANTLVDGDKHEWAWVARTYLFDQFISCAIQAGSDLIVNLAAGLDARPYRMNLAADLQWIEVDLPEIIAYKEQVLAAEMPRCRLERIALDLADQGKRLSLFKNINERSRKAVIVTEGLLIYFTSEQVASFAYDLASCSSFQYWIIDLTSPGQLKLMQRRAGRQLSEAGAAFKFGPAEGVDFFSPFGWSAREIQGMLKTAAKFNRAPAELLSLLPEPKGRPGNYPWTGVCLLQKK
jgi:methyltransferase (TIGR00027 family)